MFLPKTLARWFASTVILSSAAAAAAIPTQSEICDDVTQTLVPERLALAALGAEGVSHFPYRWITNHPDNYKGFTPAQQILSVEDFCGDNPKDSLNINRCSKGDADKISNARNSIIGILTAPKSYLVPDGVVDPGSLFRANVNIICLKKPSGKPIEVEPTQIAVPIDQKKIPLRIRGSTDGLQFDRNRDSAFAGVDKASVTFKSDKAAGKDSTKVALVVALVAPAIENVLEVSPYMGFSIDNSKKTNQPTDVSDDIWRVGALVDFRTHGDGVSHLFLLRPEFAADRKEKSEIVTANFSYLPLVNGWLNDARNISNSSDQSLISIIPRAELRANWGHFVKRGTRLDEESGDFVRIGAQVGITVTSDIKWLPFEASILQTYLRAVKGTPRSLSQLKGVVSLYFDEKKYFGIDLGYARGRRDDISKREDNWSFGFGAKF